MAKSSEWFREVFAKSTEAHPAGEKNREYSIVHDACIECIRQGDDSLHDAGYIRNQIGYNSELPTTVVKEVKDGKNVYFSRSELFGRIWNSAMSQVRLLVANASANEVWGFAFIGMKGVNGIIGPYTTAIEKGSDSVSFIASKDDVSALEAAGRKHSKISKSGQKTFTLSMDDYVKLLDAKFANMKVGEKHKEFAANYRAKLSKYAAFRSERMSMPVTDLAAKYAAW